MNSGPIDGASRCGSNAMNNQTVTALLIGLTLASPAGLRADPIDRYIEQQLCIQKVPGLSLAIVHDGKVVKAKGYGLANVEHQVPAKPETVYQAGSVGKQFTAAAVLLLAEDGKLQLDDPISRYLDGTPAIWKGITVRQLLTHTSGIRNYGPRDFNYRLDVTDQDFLAKVASFPLDFAPGSRWRYSDTGYVLLGMLISKVSGVSYGEFVGQRILRPLGMDATRVISEEDIIPNRAAGYRLLQRAVKNQEWVAPSYNRMADGCLYTTVLDLAKWDAALYTEKVLKKASLEQMLTPVKLRDGETYPYGFAWRIGELRGHKLFEHQGTWQGFRAHIVRYVEDRLTVVVLSNLSTASPGRICKQVAGMYLPALTPSEPEPLPEPEPRVAELLRTVLRQLAEGKLPEDSFTAEGRKAFFPIEFDEWHTVLKNVGPLQSLVLVDRKVDQRTRHCDYRADFGEVRLRISLALTRDNKIVELDFAQD